MKLLKCPTCGDKNIVEVNGNYTCNVCGSKFVDPDKKNDIDVDKALSDSKDVEIGNLKHILDEELTNLHPDLDKVKSAANGIIKVYADDVLANFALKFADRANNPDNYTLFVKRLGAQSLESYELNKIVPIVIKNMEYKEKEAVRSFLISHNIFDENEAAFNAALNQREAEINNFTAFKDVFVCHAHADIDIVNELCLKLNDNSISTWTSENNMPYDVKNYWDSISEAIKECKIFLFVLTENSRMSKDCMKEVNLARSLGKDMQLYRADKSEMNEVLKGAFDGVQWVEKPELLVNRLFSTSNTVEYRCKNVEIDYDNLEFGSYGGKILKWEYISRSGDYIELLSKEAVCQSVFNIPKGLPFFKKRKAAVYQKSGIRKFLTETFYDNAFTENEKKKMHRVKEGKNKDFVVLLNKVDLDVFFEESSKRALPYNPNGSASWWLADDGKKDKAYIVKPDGSVALADVTKKHSVRVVIKVKVDALAK